MNPVYRAYFILTYVFNAGGSFEDVPRFWFAHYLYRIGKIGVDDDYPTLSTIRDFLPPLPLPATLVEACVIKTNTGAFPFEG